MDGSHFDRITKSLIAHTPRRGAIRALAGAAVASVAARLGFEETAGKHKHKHRKRCRKIGQTCGGKKKCCTKAGPARCLPFPSNFECQGVDLNGKRCCGQVGARCDPNFGLRTGNDPSVSFGNCSCCDQLWCGKQPNGEFRCQEEST
jgi:hypothetical protein